VWSKVLLDKGIADRTIGRAYALIFRNQKPSLYNQKKEGETLIYWPAAQLATAYWLL
jgi:hypothetical protein